MTVPESRFVRNYYRARHYRTQVLQAASATFDAVWLGLADAERLGEIDDVFYRNVRERHAGADIGYADAAYTERGLHDWEREALEGYFPARGRILVTGAGGGREVLPLLAAGYDAVGYEPNRALVDAGNATLERLGHGADRLRPMARSGWPTAAGSCDGVIVGWGSYMSLPGRDRRIAFLRGAADAVPARGPLLVSGWHRGEPTRSDRITVSVGSAIRRLRRLPPVELGDALVDSFVHRFTVPELEGELRAAGFEPARSAPVPYAWSVGIKAG